MPRRSTIDLFVSEQHRSELEQLMLSGKFTIDELHEWLLERDYEISRSAVGRHSKKVEEIGVHMREAQQMAEALAAEVGPAFRDGETNRMLTQILSSLAFRSMTSAMKDGEDPDARDLSHLAKALKDIAGASKITDERERAIIAAEREKMAGRVGETAKAEGWSKATIRAIEEKVLGVAL
ncbi:MAG: phage protein Gp27 family protein [Pseudomonadota bacterium]